MAVAKKNTKKSIKKASVKKPNKIKKATKQVVAKQSKTAKKGIKKLVKKTIAKNTKVAKKALRKHATSSNKRKKAVARVEQETKAIMKPFGDIAVAVIDAMDNAMHSLTQSTPKKRKK
jgi:molecular chaperone GrpE (heat shock protein)